MKKNNITTFNIFLAIFHTLAGFSILLIGCFLFTIKYELMYIIVILAGLMNIYYSSCLIKDILGDKKNVHR